MLTLFRRVTAAAAWPVERSAARSRRRSSGFSLPEILVALAILATLSALLMPALFSKMREGRATTIMNSLYGMNQAVAEFRKGLGRYPGQLTLLTTGPTVSNTDACGTTYLAAAVVLWRGPYLMRDFPASGTAFGEALLYPGVRRNPTTVASPAPAIAFLVIDVGNVEAQAVTIIDQEVDNGDGGSAGTIRFTAAAIPVQSGAGVNQTAAIPIAVPGTLNLSYLIPINGSAC